MTIHEVTNQLLNLSLAGYFNGEKFTKAELEHYISTMFKAGGLKLHNRIVMEITLPDGGWLFTINKYSDAANGFDYTIPDTRGQEAALWKELTA